MRSISLAMVTCVAAIVLAGPSRAADPTMECWERQYDEAHLAKTPKQQVTEMILLLNKVQDHSPFSEQRIYREGLLKVTLRGNAERFQHEVFIYCSRQAKILSCQPSFGEGAILTVDLGANGETALVRNRKIHLNPAGYSAEDIADKAIRLRPDSADNAFRLARSDSEECKY